MSAKLPEDRTQLGELWARVVAEVDDIADALAEARKREAKVWAALSRSRALTVGAASRSKVGARRRSGGTRTP